MNSRRLIPAPQAEARIVVIKVGQRKRVAVAIGRVRIAELRFG
jgi:hypothetical protein